MYNTKHARIFEITCLPRFPLEQRAQGKLFFCSMPKVPYEKIALTFEEQLEQLSGRGLFVDNRDKALHLLSTLSYYRLSGYWYPFLEDKTNHKFKPGTTFDQAFRIYCFDRELKKLVSSQIEKIEVALRSAMIYHLSHENGPFWYTNSNLFLDVIIHARFLISLQDHVHKSKEEFIKAFKKKYIEPLPPAWMGMELISLGSLSILYSNLKPGRSKRSVANFFSISDGVFESWLHAITFVRNTCAHHARLWNKVMNIQPLIPNTTALPWLTNNAVSNNKLYYFLSIVLYLQQSISPTSTFLLRFKDLLISYPEIEVKAMGFPEDWETEALWSS